MSVIELRTLGDSRIVVRGKQLGPHSPLSFALALYLAIERGRPHPREELMSLLLPGIPTANAAHNLRQMLYNLRELGVPAETTPGGSMIAAADVRDDYSALLATGELPEQWADRLPGEFLPGYWPKVSDDYARWLELQRDGVNSALRRAYVRRILDRRAVARWDEVERYARACLVVDPLNEEATLALAEALALSGSKVAGVKVLVEYEREVGQTSSSLVLPAATLKKRIAERVQPRPSARNSPKHIGRESELREITRLFADAQAGIPKTVVIAGETGIGKTRLCREFLTTIQLHSVRIVEACCQPHDIRRPVSLMVDLVPQLLRCQGALGADPHALDLLRRLYKVEEGEATPTHESARFTPEGFAAVVTDALSELLDAVTTSQTMVLWIEDLHWADALSAQVLANLVAETKRRRLFVLTTARSVPSAIARVLPAPILLKGLGAAESTALIRAIADGYRDVSPSVIDRMVALAGGNPFFLRALSDRYAEQGSLDGIPPELRDVVSQRIASLGPTERTTLAACAVLGRLATLARLEVILELPRHTLANTLTTLEEFGFIDPRDGRIDIRHELISRAIVENEPFTRLAVVRRAAAAILEREAENSGEIAQFWSAADLWIASGEAERAKNALRTCALHSAVIGAANASIDAVTRYSAIASDAEAAQLCEAIRVRVMLRSTVNPSLVEDWHSGRAQRGASSLVQHFDLLAYEISHHRGNSEDHLSDMLRIVFDPNADWQARVRAGSIAMCVADDIDDATLAHEIASALQVPQISPVGADADSIRLLLAYHVGFGDLAKGIQAARAVAAWSDEAVLRDDSMRSLMNCGFALMQCGIVTEASAVLERGYKLATERALRPSAVTAAANRCWLARQIGDDPNVSHWEANLRANASEVELRALNSPAAWTLAVTALDRGEIATANQLIGELEARTSRTSRSSHWLMLTGLRLRAETISPTGVPVSPDVDDAVSWSIRTAPRTPEDDVALGIHCALELTDPTRASAYLDSYLAARRNLLPVLPSLSIRAR